MILVDDELLNLIVVAADPSFPFRDESTCLNDRGGRSCLLQRFEASARPARVPLLPVDSAFRSPLALVPSTTAHSCSEDITQWISTEAADALAWIPARQSLHLIVDSAQRSIVGEGE